jgi:alpha-L-arabinofuranosidase
MNSAKVKIDTKPIHDLPKEQYSHFIEHIGMCIKNGIWAQGRSGDLVNGMRRDLLETVRSINPPLIRYPGGCFADGYHWKDGIGPRQNRPKRPNLAWRKLGPKIGPKEDNHFGTDEFMTFCKEVGAKAMMTTNVGSGTAQEAADWVEYCNGPADSKWGAERAKNGHPEPYNIEYWFIGNEIFGPHERGHQKPEKYVQTVKEYAKAMKKVDPNIKLIACGHFAPEIQFISTERKVNRIVLQGAGKDIDYLSIHQYVPTFRIKDILKFQILRKKRSADENIYYDVLDFVTHMENFVKGCVDDVKKYSPPGKTVQLAFDEWNLWFEFLFDIVQTNYNLRDGLWSATMLNMFHRYAPYMPITNIAQLVNVLGIIITDERGTFLTPTALVYKLYTDHAGKDYLQSTVKCPKVAHGESLPVLDVSATRDDDRAAIFLVNRHYDSDLEVTLDLDGFEASGEISAWEIHHDNPVKYNTFRNPEEVVIKEFKDRLSLDKKDNASVSLTMKAHSAVCVEIHGK